MLCLMSVCFVMSQDYSANLQINWTQAEGIKGRLKNIKAGYFRESILLFILKQNIS